MYGGLRVLTLGREARAGERFILDDPELVAVVEGELLVRLDVAGSEKGDPRELEVLVIDKHLHRDEVRLARVIYKPGYIAVPSGVNAVRLSVL